ncbi:uncharacterized protein SCHCODRAFT_02460111, partial [Schizophyllum commune H4-8]|uniref:uncharacterized protein n=1 Tax=Schizophyllum commune (strain H4-8 / FGSC 9210) TaxID=578458 RepID=UPI00215F72CB
GCRSGASIIRVNCLFPPALSSPYTDINMYMEIPGTGVTAWVADQTDRLADNYPRAYTDFWGSGIPCVYKTGSLWPALTPAYGGCWRDRILREARPVYGHPISPTWLSTGRKICGVLDHHEIKWTSVDPLAWADA